MKLDAVRRAMKPPAPPHEQIAAMVAGMVAVAMRDAQQQLSAILEQEIGAYMKGAGETIFASVAAESGKSVGAVNKNSAEMVARLESLAESLNGAVERIISDYRSGHKDLRAAVSAESGSIKKSIPKPVDVDLSAVLSDLQWIKTVVALEKPPVETPKKEWTFTVERDRNGFIQEVKAN